MFTVDTTTPDMSNRDVRLKSTSIEVLSRVEFLKRF